MSFSWSTFVFQIVNFVVLAYVLERLLYRPLHDAIDRRREAIGRAQQDAEKARQEAADLQQQLQKQLADVERQREAAIRADREQAEKDRRALLADAGAVVQKRRQEFETSLAREREQMIQDVRGEVVQEAVDLARRILTQAADRTLHRQFCLHLVDAVNDLAPADRERIRQAWRPDEGVEVETAHDLDGKTLEQITQAVASLLGQSVVPQVRVHPTLLEGIRLRVGGEAWDSTLVGQVPEADRSALPNGKR